MESIGPPPATSSGSFFTPLVISLAGVVGTLLAILAYHLILNKYFISRRRRTSFGSGPTQGDQMEIGVEEHVLNAIPILCYSKKNSTLLRVDQSECVICLGELKEGNKVRLLPNCGHVFHVPCIDDWFLAHTSCPICRAPIIATITSVAHEPIDHEVVREGDQNLSQFLEQRDEDHEDEDEGGGVESDDVNVSKLRKSNCVLRHSLSLVLPLEGKPQRFMGLKRSLSMDQCYVIINIQRENEKASCPSSSSPLKGVLMKSGSHGARSVRQLDRMSSSLLRSFSQMRMGRSVANGILPS